MRLPGNVDIVDREDYMSKDKTLGFTNIQMWNQ